MPGFGIQDLFSALSGVSSGGTNNAYTPSSNSNTTVQGPNMGGAPQMGNNSVMTGGNNQGSWPGNMQQPQQPGQMGQGQGMMGMFRDLVNRAPGLYQAMQRGPNTQQPMMGFMNGMNMGMRR